MDFGKYLNKQTIILVVLILIVVHVGFIHCSNSDAFDTIINLNTPVPCKPESENKKPARKPLMGLRGIKSESESESEAKHNTNLIGARMPTPPVSSMGLIGIKTESESESESKHNKNLIGAHGTKTNTPLIGARGMKTDLNSESESESESDSESKSSGIPYFSPKPENEHKKKYKKGMQLRKRNKQLSESKSSPVPPKTYKGMNIQMGETKYGNHNNELYGINASGEIWKAPVASCKPKEINGVSMDSCAWKKIDGWASYIAQDATSVYATGKPNGSGNLWKCDKPCEGEWRPIAGGLTQMTV